MDQNQVQAGETQGSYPAISYATTTSTPTAEANSLNFDSDSAAVKIDNCTSACITNTVKDMIPSTVRKIQVPVKGFMGKQCMATYKGTLHWRIKDDDGEAHSWLIPNSFVVPSSKSKLFCPQHWAQEAKDCIPEPGGTVCITDNK